MSQLIPLDPCLDDSAFHVLASAAQNIQASDHPADEEAIAGLLEDGRGECLQARIFASALAKRLTRQGQRSSNIYLREYASGAQIDLFAVMSEGFPLVSLAKETANRMIIGHWRHLSEVVLLDIGIGTGSQEVDLLRMAKAEGCLPSRITIVGVEPAHGSLERASHSIEEAARELGAGVRFIPVHGHAEDLTEGAWRMISSLPGEKIAVGSFALHHVRGAHRGNDSKRDLLRRLHDLGLRSLILIEPDSDHHTSCLHTRFRNAWNHYGLAFRVIEQSALTEEVKSLLKVRFFGREVEDILSGAEDQRSERHESAEMWLGRLSEAGFSPVPPSEIPRSAVPHLSVTRHSTHLSLGYLGESIVAVIEASPRLQRCQA